MNNLTNYLEAIKTLVQQLTPEQMERLGTFFLFSVAMFKGLERTLSSREQRST